MPGWLATLLPPADASALEERLLAARATQGSFVAAAGELHAALAEIDLLVAIGQLSTVHRDLAHERVLAAIAALRPGVASPPARTVRLGHGPEVILALASLVLAERGVAVTTGPADLLVSARPLLWGDARPAAPGEIVVGGDFGALTRLAQRRAA